MDASLLNKVQNVNLSVLSGLYPRSRGTCTSIQNKKKVKKFINF